MSKLFNNRAAFIALASSLAFAFAACTDSGNGGDNTSPDPVITEQPGDTTVVVGGIATMRALASNALTYKWVHNNTDTVLVGAGILTLSPAELSDSGLYKAVVVGLNGMVVVTNNARLTVIPDTGTDTSYAFATRQFLLDTAVSLVSDCQACHNGDFRGSAGGIPPLAYSDFFMFSRKRTIATVLAGRDDQITVNGLQYQNTMPSFDWLTDVQIAAILTYIRVNFNDSLIVSCDANNLDNDGFATCVKTPRDVSTDSISVAEVAFVRDSLAAAAAKKSVFRH